MSREQGLRLAARLGEELGSLAADADWEAAALRAEECRRLLTNLLLSTAGDRRLSGEESELIGEIIAGNEALMQRAMAQRERLQCELARIQRGRDAVSAYRTCS